MEEWKEVQVLPEGVFRVQYKKMSMPTIRSMYTRIRGQIWRLQREQNQLLEKLEKKRQQIEAAERDLSTIREFLIENDPKYSVEIKAEEVLCSYLGEDAYQKFLAENEVHFKDKNGADYRVSCNGLLYKKVGGAWRTLCISKKPQLPLGDRIVAIMTAIKEHPERYQQFARR